MWTTAGGDGGRQGGGQPDLQLKSSTITCIKPCLINSQRDSIAVQRMCGYVSVIVFSTNSGKRLIWNILCQMKAAFGKITELQRERES